MEDPNSSWFQTQVLIGRILTILFKQITLNLAIFAMIQFWIRLRRRRHLVTILGVVGSSLNFFFFALERIWGAATDRNVEICLTNAKAGLQLIESAATTLMFYHLFFKARLVLCKHPDQTWTRVQIVSLILIHAIPIISLVRFFTSEPIFKPLPGENVSSCRYRVQYAPQITYMIFLLFVNLLPCALFFDGIMTLMTGGVERPVKVRIKTMLRVIFKGEAALKKLPKDKHIIRTSIGSVKSFSSRVSIRQKQLVRIVAAKRAFIAMCADFVSTVVLFSLYWWSVSYSFWMLPWVQTSLSWTFTAIACPMPEEQPKPDPNLRSVDHATSRDIAALAQPLQHGQSIDEMIVLRVLKVPPTPALCHDRGCRASTDHIVQIFDRNQNDERFRGESSCTTSTVTAPSSRRTCTSSLTFQL